MPIQNIFATPFACLFPNLVRVFSAFDEHYYDKNDQYKGYYRANWYQNLSMCYLIYGNLSIIVSILGDWIWEDSSWNPLKTYLSTSIINMFIRYFMNL